MNNEGKIRQSNFELMRIVSMFMIVFWHLFRNGTFFYSCGGTCGVLVIFIQCLLCIHVNSFVLLSGYFQYNKKMKVTKVIQINNSIWFYKFTILLLFLLTGLDSFDLIPFLKGLSPFSHGEYWFMSVYLILYLISPILNIVIENSDKKKHKRIIILLFLILSILTTITKQEMYNNNCGYSLGNFILLYFIGAYLRKYPIEKSRFFLNVSNSARRLIFLCLFFLIAFVSSTVEISAREFVSLGSIMNYIGTTITNCLQHMIIHY